MRSKSSEQYTFQTQMHEVVEIEKLVGSTDHAMLQNRDAADQHPISAITGLQEIIDEMQKAIEELKAGGGSDPEPEVQSFWPTYYGTTEDKGEITSDVIRGLAGQSEEELVDGSTFTITIPVGAMRVLIAFPATLGTLSSVKDENGMNAQIVSAFQMQVLAVESANGEEAIDYNVYVQNFAVANDTENTYAVKI